MDAARRRQRFEQLGDEPAPERRRLLALALLADRLAEDSIVPVLVGGAALEFYTAGGYSTKDVDLALPLCAEVDAAFAELGFEKEGRYWYRLDLDLLFEAPAPADLPGEDAERTVVEIEGLPITVLGVEDLLLDRLRAWVYWRSDEDGRWATRLAQLYSDEIDWEYLRGKVGGEAQERRALSEIEAKASSS